MEVPQRAASKCRARPHCPIVLARLCACVPIRGTTPEHSPRSGPDASSSVFVGRKKTAIEMQALAVRRWSTKEARIVLQAQERSGVSIRVIPAVTVRLEGVELDVADRSAVDPSWVAPLVAELRSR